ncbi:hypothetical protein BGX31_002185 [Mortierella sp. GBA43]|nr:hypothetical protein BGX31_002185 [Mortierella sp. GBA43]
MGFVESFLTERPQDGLDAVQSRLRKGRALHEQVANYFKERAHIEDMYAKSITKAFQKHFVTDTQTLGSFTAPWEKLSAEAMELATLHTQLSSRITSEVERPLRDFARTHPEWQNLTLAEANCNRIAKEFDDRHSKVTKYTKAVEKVSGKKAEAAEQKLTEYTRNLDSIRSAWRLEGPVILQKYQSVDQSRLEHLKQIASTFEAIQTEIMLQIVEISGNTSASIGEFDPLMDIELFTSEASINMQYRSVTQSKAASIDHRTADTQDQIRSASTSLFGSTIEIMPKDILYLLQTMGHGLMLASAVTTTTNALRRAAPRMHMEIKQESVTESTDEARAALERVTSTLKQTKTMSRRHPDRRNVRSMYQSEDLTGHNSYQSSPLSTPFPTDSSSGSRVLLNNSSSHLQVSTPFSPGNSRGNNLVVPPLPAHSQSQLNQPIPPMPSLTIANANGPESPSTTAPTLSAPQRLTTDPDLLANTGTSAPTSPISAPPAGTGAGHKRTWVTSVVEKVHVHTQGGQVSKMMVTGEVIMTIEGTEADPEQPTEALLRLDQLQVLEKCVPHQTYLSSEEEGAYWVDLVALSQAIQQNGAGQGIVVLKYQVKVTEEEARQTMIPLLVHPAWKCEPHQTSLLINYKVNPHCKISQPVPSVTGVPEGGDIAAQEAQLSELSFLVPISGAVVNAQSRPTGIWNSETSRMFWDVDNLTMSSTAPESQKLLARFELNSTGGPSQASPTAAKFRVQGRLLSDVKVHLERANRQEEQTRVAFGSVRLQVQSGRYLAAA